MAKPLPLLRTAGDIRRVAKKLSAQDPRLAPLVAQPIEFRLKPERSPFHALLEAIVHQQLNGRAALTIFGRVQALFPAKSGIQPKRLAQIDAELLRGAGLSYAKIAAAKDLAAKTLDGTVPEAAEILTLSDDEIVERLTSIRGIGRWTVEMLLIFTLGRPDVFPVDDFAIRKSLGLLHGLEPMPTPRQAMPLGDIWRPHRSVASLYLWNALNQPAAKP